MHATTTATPTTMDEYGDDDDDDDDDDNGDDDDLGLRATLARNTAFIMVGIKPHVSSLAAS